jgi:peroxiredoxin
VFREGLRPPNPFRRREPLEAAMTQDGMSLAELARLGPVLVVCLPALDGRPCRKLLAALAEKRREIEGSGTRIVCVHMARDDEAHAALAPHDLQYVARIADPERTLYAHFGLGQTKPRLFGRPRQLPGTVLLRDGAPTPEPWLSHQAAR